MINRETPLRAEERLWTALEDKSIGMLGLSGEHHHMQPMTAHLDRMAQTLWFFTYKTTDLARDVAESRSAMFCFEAKDHSVYACIEGDLTEDHDRSKIAEFWNPVAAAWYPDGKDDPQLTLLRFRMNEAQIWLVDTSSLGFIYEVVKANLSKRMPDVGVHTTVRF